MRALGRAWLVLDADFVVQQVSPLFAELLDRAPRRLLGLPAERLLGSELFGARSSFRLAPLPILLKSLRFPPGPAATLTDATPEDKRSTERFTHLR